MILKNMDKGKNKYGISLLFLGLCLISTWGCAGFQKERKPENITEHYDIAYYQGEDADKVKHKLNLFMPNNMDTPPIMIWIHGGAWAFGGRKFETELARRFAEDGVAVAVISYRLSPGTWRNEKFTEGVQHPEHIKDVARAFAWVYENADKYEYDQNSIFVSGYSAGGHLSALLAMDPSYLSNVGRSVREIRGAIPIAGAYDISSYHKSHLRYNGKEMAEKHVQAVFGDSEAGFRQASPTSYIRNQWVPMLVISERDTYDYTRILEEMATANDYGTMQFFHISDMDHGELLGDLAKSNNSKYRNLVVDYIGKKKNDYSYLIKDDVKLAFKVFGQGEPLFVLNGGPGFSSWNFGSFAKKFASDRQVVLFDQRGTGFSKLTEFGPESLTIDLMVQDLEDLRKHLNLETIDLFGQSFGGIYAMSYAAQYPEHVKSMILSHSPGMDMDFMSTVGNRLMSGLDENERKILTDSEDEENLELRLMKRSMAIAGGYLFDDSNRTRVFKGLTFNSRYHPDVNQMIWADLRAIPYNVRDEMKEFSKPVLIVHGKNDIVDPKFASLSHSIFPNSELKILDNCVHYGWLDAPVEYFKAIQNFFDTKG